MDAQADLSLRWVHMPLCWFSHEAAHWVLLMPGVWQALGAASRVTATVTELGSVCPLLKKTSHVSHARISHPPGQNFDQDMQSPWINSNPRCEIHVELDELKAFYLSGELIIWFLNYTEIALWQMQ